MLSKASIIASRKFKSKYFSKNSKSKAAELIFSVLIYFANKLILTTEILVLRAYCFSNVGDRLLLPI